VRRFKRDVADPGACERAALDLLARREHSRRELERKLDARGFAEELIAPTLDALEESGELASARFTESFIRARAAKGQGPARIRAELAERGIDREQAAELLQSADIDWTAIAISVRDKRFGAAPPTDYNDRARQARFLQYRGFDSGQIGSALKAREELD
jgi:regulatory protein